MRIAKRSAILMILCLLVGLSLAGSSLSAPGVVQSDHRVARFGIGFSREYQYDLTDYNLDLLKIGDVFPFGWYSDWWTNSAPPLPYGMDYAQLIWVRESHYPPNWSDLEQIIAARPGSLWMVGNEPECPYQGNRTPEEYAQIYHEVYYFIKNRDATAQVAIGGVVQPSALRRKWLDEVLAKYQELYNEPMPIDVWTIHNQILNEGANEWGAGIPAGIAESPEVPALKITIPENASLDLFKRHIREFRAWMKQRGFQDKELIISEYGVLLPSQMLVQDDEAAGNQMVINFMKGSFDFLLEAIDQETGCPSDGYRLVQKWLWYSLNEQPLDPTTWKGFNGALFKHDNPEELTVFGKAFKLYALGLYGQKVYLPHVSRR